MIEAENGSNGWIDMNKNWEEIYKVAQNISELVKSHEDRFGIKL